MEPKGTFCSEKRQVEQAESLQRGDDVLAGESALDALAGKLLRESFRADTNSVISPSCLYQMLALLSELTAGATRDQLLDALGGDGAALVASSLVSVAAPRSGDPDFHYSTGSSVWLDESVDFGDGRNLPVPIAIERVAMGTEAASSLMGAWLAENTGGIYAEGPSTDPATRFVALGAMHLKDAWGKKFKESDPRVFRIDDGSEVMVRYMYVRERSDYLEKDGSLTWEKGLSSGCRMIASMPARGTRLAEYIESGSAWENMKNFRGGRVTEEWRECDVYLPRFSLGSDGLDMTDIVKGLGISALFGPTADFGPVSPSALKVDRMLQSTRLKIDEQGLEGASYVLVAVTAGLPPKDPPKPKEIVFDRPFAIAVISPEGAPLFVGAVLVPEKGAA